MVGISDIAVYIPWLRLKRGAISSAMGWLNQAGLAGEKAVANYDEDSVTMAVAASLGCVGDVGREKIDGLYFATTTAPYRERQDAGIIAAALDLRAEVRVADFANSTKAGTAALLCALDAVAAGTMKKVIVCAGDCRPTKAGGGEEHIYGDGGAALLVGDSGVIATLEGSHSISRDFMGHWRSEYDRFEHASEDRFNRDIGYVGFVTEAISGLLRKYKLDIKGIAKVVCPGPYAREHAAIGKGIGAEPGQMQDSLLAVVGDTGAAQPLLMLAAALEEAKAGDKIIVASIGGGSDVLLLQVTDEIKKVKGKKGVKGALAEKKELTSYEKYLVFRDMLPVEKGWRGEEIYFTQVTRLYRERRGILGLVGSKCRRCGTPQYPAQRICAKPGCGAIDEMEPYRFSDKTGKLFTYTGDNLAFSVSPPEIYGMIDFDGGGRFWFDFTDCELESLRVGMPVRMSFRRRYLDERRGIHGYFWKAVPIRS